MELEIITPEPMQLPLPEDSPDEKWRRLWQEAEAEAQKASTNKQQETK